MAYHSYGTFNRGNLRWKTDWHWCTWNANIFHPPFQDTAVDIMLPWREEELLFLPYRWLVQQGFPDIILDVLTCQDHNYHIEVTLWQEIDIHIYTNHLLYHDIYTVYKHNIFDYYNIPLSTEGAIENKNIGSRRCSDVGLRKAMTSNKHQGTEWILEQ